MTEKRGVEYLQGVVDYCINKGGHDAITKGFKVTDGGDGRCVGEFTVAKTHLNANGGLHGGYIATMVDDITTYALLTINKHPGVTTDLNISYLKGAKEGDEIIVEANTLKLGKTLAFLECVLKNKTDGSLLVKGSQTKYVDFKTE